MTAHPCLRRPTTSVLVGVAVLGGAILLLGDRFESAHSYALTQPRGTTAGPAGGSVGACVAEESMRLIALDRERCQPGELELASAAGSAIPAGPPGPAGAGGVSGFEIVTARVTVGPRQTASAQARCPAGKVALGGGALPDPDTPPADQERFEVVVSAPRLPRGDSGDYGWTTTFRNNGSAAVTVVVAAMCVVVR